jgi:Mn-dependent DtxR family transcriptional regulator
VAIQESGEMYLETIHVLIKRNGTVRSIDICEELGYSKPSISRAISILKKSEYINVDKKGYITLTDEGLTLAERIYERHTIISSFLISLGVDCETASDDACKMEHILSDASFEAIKHFLGKN